MTNTLVEAVKDQKTARVESLLNDMSTDLADSKESVDSICEAIAANLTENSDRHFGEIHGAYQAKGLGYNLPTPVTDLSVMLIEKLRSTENLRNKAMVGGLYFEPLLKICSTLKMIREANPESFSQVLAYEDTQQGCIKTLEKFNEKVALQDESALASGPSPRP